MPEHNNVPARLETYLRPTMVTVELPLDPEAIDQVQAELAAQAAQDPNGCFGYFAPSGRQTVIGPNLPASQHFANAVPDIEIDCMTSEFDFLRFSNRHRGTTSLRIDTGTTTRQNDTVDILRDRLVKRTLFNVHSEAEQVVTYMDIDPNDIPLRALGLYLGLPSAEGYADRQVNMVLPPREGSLVYGFDFYSSHVLHADADGPYGHFVARYGTEVALGF